MAAQRLASGKTKTSGLSLLLLIVEPQLESSQPSPLVFWFLGFSGWVSSCCFRSPERNPPVWYTSVSHAYVPFPASLPASESQSKPG